MRVSRLNPMKMFGRNLRMSIRSLALRWCRTRSAQNRDTHNDWALPTPTGNGQRFVAQIVKSSAAWRTATID